MKQYLKNIKKVIVNNKGFFITFTLLVIFGIIVCLSKRTFHDDEPLSFALSNKIGGWVVYDCNQGWVGKDTFLNYGVTDNAFTFGNVYLNQSNDVHPPLWYMLIHLISSFFPYKFSIWFAMIINLLSYLFNLVIIYLLVNRYTHKKWLGCLAMIVYGLNSNVVDGLIFLRMYQLVSTFSLLFVFFATKIVDSEKDEWKWFILTFLTVLLGGLTHYYFYLFAVMASIVFLVILLVRKRFVTLIKAVVSVVTPMCLNILVLFPYFFRQFFGVGGKSSDNGAAIRDNLANKVIGIDNIVHGLKDSWCGILIAVIIIGLFVYYFIKKRDKKTNTIILLLIPCLLFMAFVYTFGLMAEKRYLLVVECISMVATMVLIDKTLNKYLEVGLIILSIVLSLNLISIKNSLFSPRSWDFAKDNSEKRAVVINPEWLPYYYANTSFYDFMYYKDVCMIHDTNIGYIKDLSEDFVLYVDKNLNQEEIISYINNITNNSYSIIAHEDIPATEYHIYTCTNTK